MGVMNIVGAKVWGGAEQYVYDICQEWQSHGESSYILVDRSNRDMQVRYAQVGRVWTGNLYHAKGFSSIPCIARKMVEHGIHTIICHSGKFIVLCIALKRLTGAKIIFVKHNLVPGKTDVYHRWINHQVDAFVCVSQLVYNTLMTPAIKDRSKYYVVKNGINPRRFPNHAHEVPLKEKVTLFGYSGRITERKGLYVLLHAMQTIHETYPQARLRLCGAGTEEQVQALQSYIEEHHMRDYVRYIGFVESMESFYESIDCLVLPTLTPEAFGLVICEAMYCGIPVITSSTGAQREIIDDKATGYIVEPVDAVHLAQAMSYMMGSDVILNKMIIDGRHRVEQDFLIHRVAHQLQQIIHTI